MANHDNLREKFDWDLQNFLWTEKYINEIDISKRKHRYVDTALVNQIGLIEKNHSYSQDILI